MTTTQVNYDNNSGQYRACRVFDVVAGLVGWGGADAFQPRAAT
jgi:hypothetical protein